jgi:hypothetical protein
MHMVDSPRDPHARSHTEDAGLELDGASKPGRPRWVKVALIVIAAVVVLVVVLALTGAFGAEHVPGPPAGGH